MVVRQMHQRKLIKTREEWEMMNNGLVTVLNILSTEHRRVSIFKNNQRSLVETFKRNRHITVRKTVRKTKSKLNIIQIYCVTLGPFDYDIHLSLIHI